VSYTLGPLHASLQYIQMVSQDGQVGVGEVGEGQGGVGQLGVGKVLQVLRAFGIPQRKHLYFISVSGHF
jgi:hypothetical protein